MKRKINWVLNELPPIADRYDRVSETVKVKLVGGKIVKAFYAHKTGGKRRSIIGWINANSGDYIKGDKVVGWCYEKDFAGN